MTNCWPEGALRAYLDRELSTAEMKLVAAHLGECGVCDELCAELAGRASRVFALLESLPEPMPVASRPVVVPEKAKWQRWWPAAAVALAAGLAVASFVMPNRQEPIPVIATNVPSSTPIMTPSAPSVPQAVEALESRPEPVQQVRAASGKLTPRRHHVPPSTDYFLALDDDPIESGVIMRVAVEPGNAQADIVFDPGGRARAIRLVGNKQ